MPIISMTPADLSVDPMEKEAAGRQCLHRLHDRTDAGGVREVTSVMSSVIGQPRATASWIATSMRGTVATSSSPPLPFAAAYGWFMADRSERTLGRYASVTVEAAARSVDVDVERIRPWSDVGARSGGEGLPMSCASTR
jgi:hypothetical protein